MNTIYSAIFTIKIVKKLTHKVKIFNLIYFKMYYNIINKVK